MGDGVHGALTDPDADAGPEHVAAVMNEVVVNRVVIDLEQIARMLPLPDTDAAGAQIKEMVMLAETYDTFDSPNFDLPAAGIGVAARAPSIRLLTTGCSNLG